MDELQNHLNFTHSIWKRCLTNTSLVIDATLGNGHDTLFLAPLVKKIWAFDIQNEAIKSAKEKLLDFDNISFYNQCHSNFCKDIAPKSISLIVYNLGWLPGNDKSITTKKETTLSSINKSLELINDEGLISITLYPGHLEGQQEEKAVLDFALNLERKTWSVSLHSWINRLKAPSVVLIHKRSWHPMAH
jgi:hypothetical protein